MIVWACPTACLALLAMAPLGSDHGAAPVIAVVSPPQADRAMLEALNRFRGEAAAVGFAVTIVAASKGSPSAQMEAAARAVPGVATVAFVRGGDPTDLDVWFTDRLDGQTLVDHVSVESNRADRAVVLAVKAVDVLRARMFGLLARRGRTVNPLKGDGGTLVAGSGAAAAPAASPATREAATGESIPSPRDSASPSRVPPSPFPAQTVPPPAPTTAKDGSREDDVAAVRKSAPAVETPADGSFKNRFGIALGLGTLRTFPALGNPMLFIIRGEYDVAPRAVLRITAGGIGSRQVASASAGQASVRDTLVLLEAGTLPWGRRFQPIFAGGMGLHYFSAKGTPVPGQPYRGVTVGQLVGAVSLSVGVRARINRHVGLSLDTGAQLLFPRVQVQAAGANGQTAGRPILMTSIALEGRL